MAGTSASNPSAVDLLSFGRDVLHDEARALDALADSLGESFERAVGLIVECKGKLIVSGLGKSGHVGRKIAVVWQLLWVALFLRVASNIFRKNVLKSGPVRQKRAKLAKS